jgi:FkbM family methyltransferase
MENIDTFRTKYGLITLFKNERYIGDSFKRGQYWDEDSLIKLRKYINPELNILEIGGHCGTSTIIYSSFINEDAKIFVCEPQENMFKLLTLNVNQNNLQNKIIPNNKGVFCYEGYGNMHNIDMDGGGGIVSKRYTEEKDKLCNFGGIGLGKEGEKIFLTTIDNMNIPNIGFIHCDAQGSENFIFSKSIDTINKFKPVILYENYEFYGKYLYQNVCNSYPEYIDESKFDIKKYCVENLNYSFIDRFNNSIDTLLIPPQNNFDKIIYITNKNINDKLLKVKKEWEVLNPEYKVELYDDARCIELLEKYYGKKYCDIFNFIPDGPIKADFFRACIIYVFGGIYVDADIKPLIPLKDYVDDDLDFMTCVSYNYNTRTLPYNPQLIVSKKYSLELLNIINEYEKKYDNREKYPYSYWDWSICKLFNKINNFDITPIGDNIFTLQNKKYKFIIEEIIDKNTKNTYNFENFLQNREDLLKNPGISVYCKYKNTIVFENFENK